LSARDLHTLVSLLVEQGLLDPGVEVNLPGFANAAAELEDAGIDVLEVNLIDYVGPGHAGGPVSTRLSVRGGWWLARQLPESRELQGFMAVLERIRSIERALPRTSP
jgi:hypothetical protein